MSFILKTIISMLKSVNDNAPFYTGCHWSLALRHRSTCICVSGLLWPVDYTLNRDHIICFKIIILQKDHNYQLFEDCHTIWTKWKNLTTLIKVARGNEVLGGSFNLLLLIMSMHKQTACVNFAWFHNFNM
jgi:hypothetical protein